MIENSLFSTNTFFLLKRTHRFQSIRHHTMRIFFESWHINDKFFYWFIKVKQNMSFANSKVGLPTNYFDDCLGAYVFDCTQGFMVLVLWIEAPKSRSQSWWGFFMHIHHVKIQNFCNKVIQNVRRINNLEIINLFIVSFNQIDICMIYTTLQLA